MGNDVQGCRAKWEEMHGVLVNLANRGQDSCAKSPCRLTQGAGGGSFPRMFREVLKSKLHRAMITDADVDYEGSIEIPRDLIDGADLWAGEKVLVASITTGARLETYVLEGKPGTGKILINGGAAHLIKAGERVTIMAFGISDTQITPHILL